MEASMRKLIPCPSGHNKKAKLERLFGAYWQIVCDEENCGWRIDGDTVSEVTAKWNTRAMDAELEALRNKLKTWKGAFMDEHEGTTHWDECWMCMGDPKHFQCALRHISDLTETLAKVKADLQKRSNNLEDMMLYHDRALSKISTLEGYLVDAGLCTVCGKSGFGCNKFGCCQ